MRIFRGLLYAFIIMTVSACATTGKQVKYYSLNLNKDYQSLVAANQANTKLSCVVVGPIHLANFLRQDRLVIQIGEHEIISANYHRWVEPLEEAIGKLLTHELNAKSKHYQFGGRIGQWKQDAPFNLRLEFERFHATDSAQVVVSGRYWFYESNQGLALNQTQTFDISMGLTHDGYLHAVEKLEQAIGLLSDQIVDSLNLIE